MNDLERIKEIEKTFGFPLNRVSLENLFEEKSFQVNYSEGFRNYSIDENGFVTGLALDYSPIYLLPKGYLLTFNYLQKTRLKFTFLDDYSFIRELKSLTSLNLGGNQIEDASFIRKLKSLISLDLSNNQISDVSFVKELKSLTSLDLSNNQIKNYSFTRELKSLTSLNLGGNQIEDASFIRELKSLTSLDLSNNQIEDYSFLRELKSLTSLNLGVNKIEDASFIRELKSLTSLDLNNNQIEDVSFIRELKSLTSLDLWNNQIKDTSFVTELKLLTSLNLGGNQIEDLASIGELKSLTSLFLWENQISDASFVKELKSLIYLNLGRNPIEDASFIGELKLLTSLYLFSNEISDVSFVKKLKSLTLLNLGENKIEDASSIRKLKSLTSLDLGENKIEDASFIRELKSLTSLDLSNNQVEDASFIRELKSLTLLNLGENKIEDASFIRELKSLTSLDLSNNQIEDYSFLRELKSLTSLNLGGNKIEDLASIRELKLITSLDLGGNKIEDASFIGELKSLTSLDLNNNQISNVLFINDLKFLTSLDLYGNENIDLPESFINQEFISLSAEEIYAIRRHYEQIEEQGMDYIYEAKVLIVGEPGAGKTTLRRKLKDHDYMPQEATEEEKASTVGVEIVTLEFPYSENAEINFTANLWDFGGQKIQYILHQYFFTQRSLYILLADDRKQLTNFHYWFEIIGTLGKNCPVLVVLNEINHHSVTNFDLSEYKREFGKSLKSIAEKEVDFSKTDVRFKSLDEEIKSKLCLLEHIGKPLPKQWIPIREELGKIREQKPYIEIDDYYEICARNEVTNKDYQKDILHYFHDLGIALNYENDKNLRGILILRPNWVIDALYVVLRNKKVKENCGKFNEEDVFKLWEKDYNRKDSETLLRLMEKGKFEVAYQIGKTNEYMVPALLPTISPEYVFDGNNLLQIYFQYKFMPPGIISRLVVRLHESIVSQNDEQIVWEKGVLLAYKESVGEIIESDYLKQIQIKVSGANPIHNKELVTIIRNEVQKIHYDWFDNRLIFDEFVPCICGVCKNAENKKFYKLSILEGKISRGRQTIECDQSDEDVNVRELLEGVYIEDVSRKEDFGKRSITNNYNIDNRITMEDANQNTILQGSRDINFTQNINTDIDKKLEELFSNLSDTQEQNAKALAQEIVDFFSDKLDKLNPELKENYESAKTSGWKTKFKLSVPLIKYLGINFETEREITSDEVVSGIRKLIRYNEDEVLSILNSQPERPPTLLDL